MTNTLAKLTGITLADDQFRLYETKQYIEIDKVLDVLQGKLAAYRISQYLQPEACNQIVNNFWSSNKKVARYGYGDGENGVEGYFVGASHIEKTTKEYLEEANNFYEAVKDLYKNTINPIATFREALVAKDNKYKTVRPAKALGLSAGDTKAVYWSDMGEFLLKPHEDWAQTRDPRQADFEIQTAIRIMAINFYAEVPKNFGQLKIWNIEPDNETRIALNLSTSGYPYPMELLQDFNSLIIPVETGDLCIINGNLVHAVIRGDTTALSKKRLLITCFMTFNDQHELIWWT